MHSGISVAWRILCMKIFTLAWHENFDTTKGNIVKARHLFDVSLQIILHNWGCQKQVYLPFLAIYSVIIKGSKQK